MYSKHDVDKIGAMSEVLRCDYILRGESNTARPITREEYKTAWRKASGYFNDEWGAELAWSAMIKVGWSFSD